MVVDKTSLETSSPNDGGAEFDASQSGGVADVASQTKQAVTETAQETVETAKSAAKEIAGTAQEQVSQAVDQAVTQTAETISQVKEQASSVFVEQRDRAIAGLSGLADALRETGRTLADQTGNGDAKPSAAGIAPLIDEIADRLASSSDFLKDKDVRQLIDDAENLARRQPMLFIGALFGVGVVGARLLKGTLGSADEKQQSSTDDDANPPSGWNAGTGWATSDVQPSSDADYSPIGSSRNTENADTEGAWNSGQPSTWSTGSTSLTGESS